jgi:hypothetical protein
MYLEMLLEVPESVIKSTLVLLKVPEGVTEGT